jgi:hypothetical protein
MAGFVQLAAFSEFPLKKRPMTPISEGMQKAQAANCTG